jgi:hypothetical protein
MPLEKKDGHWNGVNPWQRESKDGTGQIPSKKENPKREQDGSLSKSIPGGNRTDSWKEYQKGNRTGPWQRVSKKGTGVWSLAKRIQEGNRTGT